MKPHTTLCVQNFLSTINEFLIEYQNEPPITNLDDPRLNKNFDELGYDSLEFTWFTMVMEDGDPYGLSKIPAYQHTDLINLDTPLHHIIDAIILWNEKKEKPRPLH